METRSNRLIYWTVTLSIPSGSRYSYETISSTYSGAVRNVKNKLNSKGIKDRDMVVECVKNMGPVK